MYNDIFMFNIHKPYGPFTAIAVYWFNDYSNGTSIHNKYIQESMLREGVHGDVYIAYSLNIAVQLQSVMLTTTVTSTKLILRLSTTVTWRISPWFKGLRYYLVNCALHLQLWLNH